VPRLPNRPASDRDPVETKLRIVLAVVALALALLFGAPLHAQGANPVPRGHVRLTLPVATRDLARGDTLQAADVALVDTLLVWRWTGAPADTARAVTGWVARRAIAKGELLRAPAVAPPPVVASGSTVTAIWQDGPVRLVLTGVALNTAAAGAPVGVRIDRTRRLDGVAVAPNTVRLR
jgi:flagella basal body P-ring formation protein FlgA